MSNNRGLKGLKDVKRAALVQKTADIVGVTTRQVQHVLRGDRNNLEILEVFFTLKDLDDALDTDSNTLLQRVKQLVPFESDNI